MIVKVMPRVISLVPSLTETLLEAQVEVVGRTRFCIHPRQEVARIPAIGGTKEVDWRQTVSLNADLVIFDREENTQEMAKSCPWPWLSTHIQAVDDVAPELQKIAAAISSPPLQQIADRWQKLEKLPACPWQELPGVLEWLEKPTGDAGESIDKLVYLIWKNPWMAVSSATFIGSVFDWLGFGGSFLRHEKKYPEVDLEALADEKTLLLFSSEPFPFHHQKKELLRFPGPKAIVDGESFSWFGVRTLRFLEDLQQS